MKKILLIIMTVALALAFICCGEESVLESTSTPESVVESVSVSESKPESEPQTQPESKPDSHAHKMTQYPYRDSNCRREGNIEYWKCGDCGKYYTDSNGKNEVSKDDTVIAKKPHKVTLVEGVDSTCFEVGYISYYDCDTCAMIFSDTDAKNELSEEDVVIAKKPHEMSYFKELPAKGESEGCLEHWQCSACQNYYLDADGETLTAYADLITKAPYTLVDFIVEVPTTRTPVVLQLSDPQIIDAQQARPGRDGVPKNWWDTDKVEDRCYKYIRETINAVKPDLIIITGDIVYGEFDDSGTALLGFIEFMEGFNIPWAPVFGNHDNESAKGADWQCDQFENAKNCLFLQRELTGNGNYSVGISQGGFITRVFYMLDSNGCGNASKASTDNKHTKVTNGFGNDQVEWYTKAITEIKKSIPEVNVSFAYHIQQAIFTKAYEKYGFENVEDTMKKNPINIDTHPDKAEGDFGYLGRALKGAWDGNYKIFNGMVALGTDSIFVGHEHCNSASVVYEGVRFQFGQKSSEYDRYNAITTDGTIVGAYVYEQKSTSKSIMGGTVIPLDENGELLTPYIYYCGDIFGTNPKN